jgi:hypothetical protein
MSIGGKNCYLNLKLFTYPPVFSFQPHRRKRTQYSRLVFPTPLLDTNRPNQPLSPQPVRRLFSPTRRSGNSPNRLRRAPDRDVEACGSLVRVSRWEDGGPNGGGTNWPDGGVCHVYMYIRIFTCLGLRR